MTDDEFPRLQRVREALGLIVCQRCGKTHRLKTPLTRAGFKPYPAYTCFTCITEVEDNIAWDAKL